MTRNDPLADIAATVSATPQSQPIPGREAEMVRNDAGGYTFSKDQWTKLEDFAVLGTEGGTYYMGEREHTIRNFKVVTDAVRADPTRTVMLASEINAAMPVRAPKPGPQLFIASAVEALGDSDPAARAAARAAIRPMLRTTDHVSTYVGYFKGLRAKDTGRGKGIRMGRAFQHTLQDYFLIPDVEKVAWRVCKARQRKTPQGENLTVRDLLRLAHPVTDDQARKALFGWIAGNVSDDAAREQVQTIDRFLRAQAVGNAQQAIAVVNEHGVPWEFLPSSVLDDPKVWEALIGTVGLTALRRNLARMSRIGTLSMFRDEVAERVIARLTDPEAVLKARIHPMDAFLAQRIYMSGQSVQMNAQGKVVKTLQWQVNPAIVDALDGMYEVSFGAVQPSGRKTLNIIDSSGSMTGGNIIVGGSRVGASYEVACAMALIIARVEGGNAGFIECDTRVKPSWITPQARLAQARLRNYGGATDMGEPIRWAQREGLKVDGFTWFTDHETWAGMYNHPAQAWANYKSAINPQARQLVTSMAATGHTIADPKDPGVLQLAGLDASLPTVLSGWLR